MKQSDLELTKDLLVGNWEVIKCPPGKENALTARYIYSKNTESMTGALTPYNLIEVDGLFVINKHNEQLLIAAISCKYMIWLKGEAFYILKRI